MNISQRLVSPSGKVIKALPNKPIKAIVLRPYRSASAPPMLVPTTLTMVLTTWIQPISINETPNFCVTYKARNGKSREPPILSTNNPSITVQKACGKSWYVFLMLTIILPPMIENKIYIMQI